MSGTDARRGFNFQDACTISYILDVAENPDWLEIQVEGPMDIEDVNVLGPSRIALVRSQIKQKKDNDLWGPAELRKTLQAFAQYNDPDTTHYHFVYGGREGDDFVTVRHLLETIRYEGIESLTEEQTSSLEARFGRDVVDFLRKAGDHLELIKLGDRHSVRNSNVLRLVDMLVAQGHTKVSAKTARSVHDHALLAVIEKTDDDSPYRRVLSRGQILELLGTPSQPKSSDHPSFSVTAYSEWVRRRTHHLPAAVPLYVQRTAEVPLPSAPHGINAIDDQAAHGEDSRPGASASVPIPFKEAVREHPLSAFVGEPGDGKTMCLWSLALEWWSRVRDELKQDAEQNGQAWQHQRVPIYVNFAGYQSGSVLELVSNALAEAGQRIEQEAIISLAEKGDLMLLCDDLDLARADKLGQLLQYLLGWSAAYPSCSLIITTSRPSDGNRLGLPTFKLLPLSDQVGEQIVRQVIPNIPLGLAELRAGLPQESHHLLTSPLTLRMLAEIYVYSNGHVPRSRSPLYQAALGRFLELNELKGYALFDRSDKGRMLAALGKWMQDTETYSVSMTQLGALISSWTSLGSSSGLAHLAGSDLLRLREELAHSGVLQVNTAGNLEFTHSTYRAFLAASALEARSLPEVLELSAWRTSLVLWASLREQAETDSLVELLRNHPILLGQVLRERAEKRHPQARNGEQERECFSRFFDYFSALASQFSLLLQGKPWSGLPHDHLGLTVTRTNAGYVLIWHLVDDFPPVRWTSTQDLVELAGRAGSAVPLPIWTLPIAIAQKYHPLELAYIWVLRSIYELLHHVGWQGGLMVAEVARDKGVDPAVSLLLNRFMRFHDLCTELPMELRQGLPFYATQSFDLAIEVHKYLDPSIVRFAVVPGHDPAAICVSPTVLNNASDQGVFEKVGPNSWQFKGKEAVQEASSLEEIELTQLQHMSPGQVAEGWLKKHLEESLYGYPPEAW